MGIKNGIRKSAGNPYLAARSASLQMFSGIDHRMQTVREWNDIEFINDSKSTDIESSYFSLELITSPITWIIGSTEMETDYKHVIKLVKYKVVNLIVFGQAGDSAIFDNYACIVDCYIKKDTLADAVQEAATRSKKGSVVLFSPACSSFDVYEDFTERGEHFNNLVNNLN